MATLTIHHRFEAPIERVFDVLTDFDNLEHVVQAIDKTEKLVPGPVGLGTSFRETRTLFGREATETMKVIGFDPPRSFVLGAMSHGTRYESTYTLTAADGGAGPATDLELSFVATPKTWLAKLLGFLMSGMTSKMIELFKKDLVDIQRHVEAGPVEARGPGEADPRA